MKAIEIADANLILRCPPGCDNCIDIVVREEEIDGTVYRHLELELNDEERKAIAEGGTLRVSQMGLGWVPVAVAVLDTEKTIIDAE